MAEEQNKSEQVEVRDRGLFDFMGKKKKEEERAQEDQDLVTGVENLHVDEAPKVEEKKEEEKKESLQDKLHRSNSSSSSSSSEEEECPDGEKRKKKKKGLKEKQHGDKKEAKEEKNPAVVVTEPDYFDAPAAPPATEKIDETVKVEAVPEEEKKGFLEKIKEKLPGHHKKEGEEQVAIKESATVSEGGEGQDGKEKKGIFEKIMEKLPGHHHKEEIDTPAVH